MLHVELLESRDTPAGSAYLVGPDLHVVGDSLPNVIKLNLSDLSAVPVVIDGVSLGTFDVSVGRVVIAGGVGADTLDLSGDATGRVYALTAANSGNIDGVHTFASVENLTAGSGDDTCWVATATAQLWGKFHGSAGVDWLTYAGLSSAVNVNLSLANPTATKFSGVTGVECVEGGHANDVLTGNNGANVLLGGGGADRLNGMGGDDILIGGDGTDVLSGGDGNDLLYGGESTRLRIDLLADLAVWGVDGDTTNLADLLWSMSDDSDMDRLTGGAGADYFRAEGADIISDLTVDDTEY